MSGQAFTFQINLDPSDLVAAARIRDWPVYWLPFQQQEHKIGCGRTSRTPLEE